MQKIIVGIDVGLTGAIAAIGESGEFVGCWDMPLESYGQKGKKRINAKLLHGILLGLSVYDVVACRVELVAARPNQGVTGMFSFGDSFGCVRMASAICGYPVEYITPRNWKTAFSMLGTDKDFALIKAREVFPNAPLNLKKHIGRADALLIAHSFCLAN